MLGVGACYKFEVRTSARASAREGRPLRARFEAPPLTASIIWDDHGLRVGATTTGCATAPSFGGWHDRPMSIYEVHLGSWRRVPEDGNRF